MKLNVTGGFFVIVCKNIHKYQSEKFVLSLITLLSILSKKYIWSEICIKKEVLVFRGKSSYHYVGETEQSKFSNIRGHQWGS